MMSPNDLANALTLARPGDLYETLKSCTPEELAVVEKIVRRNQMVREVHESESSSWIRDITESSRNRAHRGRDCCR